MGLLVSSARYCSKFMGQAPAASIRCVVVASDVARSAPAACIAARYPKVMATASCAPAPGYSPPMTECMSLLHAYRPVIGWFEPSSTRADKPLQPRRPRSDHPEPIPPDGPAVTDQHGGDAGDAPVRAVHRARELVVRAR